MSYLINKKGQTIKSDENAPIQLQKRKREIGPVGENSAMNNELGKKILLTPLVSVNSHDESTQYMTTNSNPVQNMDNTISKVNKTPLDTTRSENNAPTNADLQELSDKIESLQDTVSKIVDAVSFLVSNTSDKDQIDSIQEELKQEKEKVSVLTTYTKECIDHNDELASENEALKKENGRLKSENTEYVIHLSNYYV